MKNGLERRLYPRRRARIKVVFKDEFGDGLLALWSENISVGGLFIASDIPIRIGSYVFLSFSLPDAKDEISATGQVVRIARKDAEEGVGEREGIGIRFVGLSSEASEAIRRFVS